MPADGDSLLAAALKGRKTVPLEKLSETLKAMGIQDDLTAHGATAALHQYHYRKDGRDIYHLMNVSTGETLNLTLHLPQARSYGLYDAMEDRTYALQAETASAPCALPPIRLR